MSDDTLPPPGSDPDHSDEPGGSTGIPGLDDVLRMLGLGDSGSSVDLASLPELLQQMLGPDAQLPPELAQAFAALASMQPGGSGESPGSPAALIRQQFEAFFGAQSPQSRLASSTDLARKVVVAHGDRVVTEAEQHEVEQAVSVARLWLDPVTAFDSPAGPAMAWSAAEWVEATMARWYAVIEPVSDGVAAAGAEVLRSQLGEGGLPDMPGLPGMADVNPSELAGQLAPMLRQLSTGMFSAQIGHAVGTLAGDVLSGTEVGLAVVDEGTVALLPARVAEFGTGLEVEAGEVRLYLAVREAARVRLFAEVPWLAAQVEAAVRDYGRHVSIDTDAIEEAMRSVDLHDLPDLSALQHTFSHAELFGRSRGPEQQAALTRLEATLALVEGWVDLVTEQAVAAHLPHAAALAEAVRRRRAGGPAQKAFAGLVGLELRPRRLREARNLWAALEDRGGVVLRDGSWAYPDLAPTAADLDDPLDYVERRVHPPARDEMDAELDKLLSHNDPAD